MRGDGAAYSLTSFGRGLGSSSPVSFHPTGSGLPGDQRAFQVTSINMLMTMDKRITALFQNNLYKQRRRRLLKTKKCYRKKHSCAGKPQVTSIAGHILRQALTLWVKSVLLWICCLWNRPMKTERSKYTASAHWWRHSIASPFCSRITC